MFIMDDDNIPIKDDIMFFLYDVMFPYVNTWEGDVFVWEHVKTFGNTSPWAMWTSCHACQMAQCCPCHITVFPHHTHIGTMSPHAMSLVCHIKITYTWCRPSQRPLIWLKMSLMMVHVMFCQLMGGCTHTSTLCTPRALHPWSPHSCDDGSNALV